MKIFYTYFFEIHHYNKHKTVCVFELEKYFNIKEQNSFCVYQGSYKLSKRELPL